MGTGRVVEDPTRRAQLDKDATFLASVEAVLQFEGGYVNHPQDPGGETKFGISQRRFPALDIRGLRREEAVYLYYVHYWLASGANRLGDRRLAAVHFDAAVNHGVGQAKSFLAACDGDYLKLIELRRAFYGALATRPRFKVFLPGWLNRLRRLEGVVRGL